MFEKALCEIIDALINSGHSEFEATMIVAQLLDGFDKSQMKTQEFTS